MAYVIIIALTFLICWLVDKGFTKLFRSKPQHSSGKSLRLNKHYGGFGLILFVLGLAALFAGLSNGALLIIGGCCMILLGIGMVVYYMTFGVYYDEDSFVLTTFGKRSMTFSFGEIRSQQLYASGRQIVMELYMKNGQTVQLNSRIKGVYEFMDHAFAAWLRQTGKKKEDCPFYDPENSCWFPPVEE